ncbi:MAG TPA: universal stress protein [Acidimicrobiales bacterium]|jgi:nucleotide-binding universal stress UspA family protein|nr:universal stress protein [Acidimicrobiales bacterium]
MKRVLVAVDETEASRRAAEFVDRFFAGMDVSITAVNVARQPVEWLPATPYGGVFAWPWPYRAGADAAGAEEELAQEAVRRAEVRGEAIAAAQAPAGAEIEVVFGEAVDAISAAAEDENADLIVVGSNDKGFLQRLFGGSVSERLAREAPRPVLVVR